MTKKKIELMPIKKYHDFKFIVQETNKVPVELILDIMYRVLDWVLSGNSIEDSYVLNLFENFRVYANSKLTEEEIININNMRKKIKII